MQEQINVDLNPDHRDVCGWRVCKVNIHIVDKVREQFKTRTRLCRPHVLLKSGIGHDPLGSRGKLNVHRHFLTKSLVYCYVSYPDGMRMDGFVSLQSSFVRQSLTKIDHIVGSGYLY